MGTLDAGLSETSRCWWGLWLAACADGVCDSPPAPSPSVLLGPSHAFLAFFGRQRARGRGCTCTFQLRCHCRGCYSPQQEPRSKQDGGSPRQLFSTVPLPLSTWLGFFSVLSDRVWRVAVACVCGVVPEPPSLPGCILLGTCFLLISTTSPHFESLLDSPSLSLQLSF